MQRTIGLIAAALLAAMDGSTAVAGSAVRGEDTRSVDIPALLTAARGAPPLVCALAAQAVRGNGWGRWSDAPATPLGDVVPIERRDFDRRTLSAADQALL